MLFDGGRKILATVCVPVRNEEALLPGLLDALAGQSGAPDFALCLLLDNCIDGSTALVAERSSSLPFAVISARAASGSLNAGLARRRAMDLGLSIVADDGAILSTDADTTPDPDWLCANLAALEKADVAAGRVVRADGPPCPIQDRVEAYYDQLFAWRRELDPVPWEAPQTHHYTSGASLAFRVGTYRGLGGFEPLPSSEDARLVDNAHRVGLRVRRDAAIRVATSARRDGRAAGGIADHLRQLDAGLRHVTMVHPADATWRYTRHAAARAAWPDMAAQRSMLARELCCDVGHIDRVAADAGNAEAFAMRVVPEIPGGERTVSLDEAEIALAQLSRCPQEQAA